MYEKLEFEYARDSLRYLVRKYGIMEIHIPYYLCDVIRHSVIAENCKPVFYHIDDNFFPAKVFDKEDFILYPNYFGVCGGNTDELEKIYPNLIVDNAHAYYLSPQGLACFNSRRKFLPEQTGSDLYVKKEGESADVQQIRPDEKRREEFNFMNEKYGITNLLNHKGKTNNILLEWSKKYKVYNIESNYISFNDNSIKVNSNEVYITNANY